MTAEVEFKGYRRIPAGEIAGEIKFQDVSFQYPTRPEQTVLEDLNLEIGAGKVMAICGPSGSGKRKRHFCEFGYSY